MQFRTTAASRGIAGESILPIGVYPVIAVMLIAFGVSVVGDAEAVSVAGAIGTFLGLATAGGFFIHRSRPLEWTERRAWSLVGLGLMVASLGIVTVVLLVLAAGDAPSVGPVDLFFIVGYTTAIVGFASLPHTAGTRLQRARIAIDGLIGAVSIGSLFWVLVLAPIVEGFTEAPPWERVVGSVYPVLDLAAVVVFMIVLARRSTYRFDIRLVIFTAAIFLQTIADVSYMASAVGQSFATAQPLHSVYIMAAGAFLASALIVDRVPHPREYADRRVALWAMLAPYTAAAVMVGVLVVRLWDGDLNQGDRILLIGTLVVAVLVIGRQGIAIRENRRSVERQRSELVSSISHELRTPLTAMVGFLAILQEDDGLDAAERVEMIGVVTDQAVYLERIVEDLLLLAHEDPSRIDLNVAERRIASVVESSLRATTIDRRRVTSDVDPDLTAIIDGNRIQQVLVNLLSNAGRYGGDHCLIVAYAQGGRLIIEVHDSGPGVPKKHELTIWERFERGPNRYNAAVPGSGIGLAMVRAIVEAHGGRATYRPSERLGGACFAMELPGRVGRRQADEFVPSSTMVSG